MKTSMCGWVLAIWGVIVIAGFTGWIMNIVAVAHTCCEVSGMLVLRVVGIFVAPLGAVLGFF